MIHALFAYYAASPLGVAIANSSWAFAVIEVFHLIALSALGGGLLVATLGLSGLVFRFADRRQLWQGLRPLLLWSFAAIAVTGALLVGSNPMKYYFNDAFRVKMLFLGAALIVTFFADRVVDRRFIKLAVICVPVVLILWLGVALAGRLIGLL
jgi:hypothetical protein